MTIKLRCINKIIVKIKNLHKKLFSYPSFRYEKVLQNKYWQKRKNNSLVIQPNDFQLERARLVSQNIHGNNVLLFDIGSGDGSQVAAIRNIFPKLKIFCSDNDPYAFELLKSQNLNCFLLKNEKEIFKLLKQYSPKYISIFEVLEHMKSPEEFLMELLNQKGTTVFASVPNSGYFIHRMRFFLGRFPLQWVASPNEHLRFWTFKDLKWWFQYLNLFEKVRIIPYKGIPILNKLKPNLFAQGLFIVIDN